MNVTFSAEHPSSYPVPVPAFAKRSLRSLATAGKPAFILALDGVIPNSRSNATLQTLRHDRAMLLVRNGLVHLRQTLTAFAAPVDILRLSIT